MPFFAEQYRNTMYLVWKNAGIFLDKVQLSSEQVVDAFRTLLENETYKINAEKLRISLIDQPMDGRELGAFWSEFVVKRKGFPPRFFVNQGKHLNFFQYFLLDVIGVCILCDGLLIGLTWWVVLKVIRKYTNR